MIDMKEKKDIAFISLPSNVPIVPEKLTLKILTFFILVILAHLNIFLKPLILESSIISVTALFCF